MKEKGHTVQGYRASAVAAGLKKNGALDLGLIVSDVEAAGAAVFTTNRVKAAPVLLSQEHVRHGRVRAILANAGNANACTGKEGLERARRTARDVARLLGVREEEVLVASTGVIGAPLDTEAVTGALPDLLRTLSPDGISQVAEAVMTTDSFSKLSVCEGRAGGKAYRILGLAKGAGMIMPDMATMLCFVVTDIAIDAKDLKRALSAAVQTTFNRITVDGDTSTNDTVAVLANGLAGNGPLSGEEFAEFQTCLRSVLGELALMIVRDGEGATKVVTVRVKGAASPREAETAARTIANSALVKTTCYGEDPNWGRILAALGRSGIRMEEDRVDILVDDVKIVEAGLSVGVKAEQRAAENMKKKEFVFTVFLGQGDYQDQILTCDLTHEYVSINADYRT